MVSVSSGATTILTLLAYFFCLPKGTPIVLISHNNNKQWKRLSSLRDFTKLLNATTRHKIGDTITGRTDKIAKIMRVLASGQTGFSSMQFYFT